MLNQTGEAGKHHLTAEAGFAAPDRSKRLFFRKLRLKSAVSVNSGLICHLWNRVLFPVNDNKVFSKIFFSMATLADVSGYHSI